MSKQRIVSFAASLAILLISFNSSAQTAEEYYSKARRFINQSRLDSASYYIDKALRLSPDDIAMLEDQVYIEFLRRDFAKALPLGKALIARPTATVKSFQLYGMTLKEIADYKEAKKCYETGIQRFPASGLLYADYGVMLMEAKKKSDAIRSWEKGIEMEPSYSANYFHAAQYHADNKNPFWAILYAENFVNIESLSDRTLEAKSLLTTLYRKISAPGFLNAKGNAFANAVISTLNRQPAVPVNSLNVDALTLLRSAFSKEWSLGFKNQYPYRLFEYHEQLMKEGLFEAYNQWLFGAALNQETYDTWTAANKDKMDAFQKYAGSRIYKVPAGQYYQSK